MISTLISDGIEPTISTISIIGNLEEGFTKENLESSEPKAYVKLNNLAVFKGDKLIDFANHEESIGLNILSNQVNEMYFEIEYNNNLAIIDTTNFKSKLSTKLQNGVPIVNIDLEGEGKIIETHGKIDLEDNSRLGNE